MPFVAGRWSILRTRWSWINEWAVQLCPRKDIEEFLLAVYILAIPQLDISPKHNHTKDHS